MQYAYAKRLKASLLGETLAGVIPVAAGLPKAAIDTGITARAVTRPHLPFAIGLRGAGTNYRLAIRVQSANPGVEQAIEDVRRRARGECDVEVIGKVVKQAKPWHQRRNRPLQVGGSIAHFRSTAGTLGCFVTDRADCGRPGILLQLARTARVPQGHPHGRAGRKRARVQGRPYDRSYPGPDQRD